MHEATGITRASAVIGRDAELAALRRGLDASATTVLVGEGGVGKTRLLTETAAMARDRRLAVLAGRAPITAPTPFSVVTEALRSWLRSHPVADALAPYDRGLVLVLPEWPVTSPPADLEHGQLRLLALEGVVRLLRAIVAEAGGATLIADDLHAADAESLETLRYVAAARIDGLAIVCGMRPSHAQADEFARAVDATVVRLSPLDERAVGDLVAALLEASPPSALVADVLARTDGVPLFVEELVRAHLVAGTVTVDTAGAAWRGGAAGVPGTIRDLVTGRLAPLDDVERRVLDAGAVVGDFAPAVMRAVSGAEDADIARAIAAGVRAGLLENVDGAVSFRHAIIREAVLDAAVPHLLDTMHRAAADALGVADDDAERLDQRAHHLVAIGDHDGAAQALVAAADLWLGRHALLASERAARAARDAATSTELRAAASDAIAVALAAQGRWLDALELDAATTAEHGDSPARRLRRAAAALDAGKPDIAEAALEAAQADEPTAELLLVAGRVAMVRGRAEDALARARAVLDDAGAGLDAHLAALDLEGRAHDFLGDRDAARVAWSRQARDAAAAGRIQAQMRAVVQLGKVELFSGEPPVAVREAVALARAAGSLVELAWAEENLIVALALRGELAELMAMQEEAIARCEQLGLDQVAYLLAGQAITRSYLQESVDAEFDALAARFPTPDLLLHTAGMRGDIAVRRGKWDEALAWFERSVELSNAMPGVVPMDSVCWLPWIFTVLGRRDDAQRALAEAKALPDLARFYTRPVIVAAADALLAGDEAGVDAAIAAAPGPMVFEVASMRLAGAHVASDAARKRWLREAYDIFESVGATFDADRVRQLLRDAGGAVPRRKRVAETRVPKELADAGVTAREAEVLRLLAQGLPNAEIAERLFVSVRTVEAHVSSLLRRLDARNRGELVARSATIDFDP